MVGKKNKTLNMLIRIVYKLRTVKDNFYHYDTILDIVQPYDFPLPNKDDYISLSGKSYRVQYKEFKLNEQNRTLEEIEIILT